MITPTVSKTISWEAGHRLMNYSGACKNYHGHSYYAEITIGSKYTLDEMGFVVDFSEIKEKVKKWIDKNWDHAFFLNSKDKQAIKFMKKDSKVYLFDGNPTAERIAQELYEKVVFPEFSRKSCDRNGHVNRELFTHSVTIWETENSCATYGLKHYTMSAK